ncbi:MAG TPA: hypothetical protein VNW46_08910 [Gemmatimonadaceae bacterium]|nr:hypothetical protein [Gemmatimonadaceae bacterium]
MPFDPSAALPGEAPLARLTRTTLADRLSRALASAIQKPVDALPALDIPLRAYVVHLKQHGALPEHAVIQVRESARRVAEEIRLEANAEWTDPEMFVTHVERRCFRAYYRAD